MNHEELNDMMLWKTVGTTNAWKIAEYDHEDEEISRIDDNTFTVDGTIDIEEIEELIGKELPEGDYETLAGFIIDQLQFLPKDGEMNEVEFENIKFTVLKVDERRIENRLFDDRVCGIIILRV